MSTATLIKAGCDMSTVTSAYHSHFVSNASTLSSVAEEAISRTSRMARNPYTFISFSAIALSGEGDA